ncbi:MAG: amidohydrolase family protein, partial [Acidisphaera sp.]|nr:amidohydrolase family protein [Acidisphaera sp.]
DPARFPYRADTRYRPSGQEVAPVDQFIRMMDLYGIRHALVVATNSGYAEDLSPVLDAIARGDGRFKGVAVVANDIAAADLARLKASGMLGVAFNAPFNGTAYYAGTGDLLEMLTDLDMTLQIQVREDQLLDFLPLIERSEVRLVIDHCGRPAPERGLDQPGFAALLGLGRARRACVKLSGFSQFSGERYPYRDAHPFIAALLDAFTPDGCLWGSDWPFLRATERIDYGPLLLLAESILPDATGRQKVFWDTPQRLFGFAA